MDALSRLLDGALPSAPEHSVQTAAIVLSLAFATGQLIAWVYAWTHSGVSYSRSFTQSLVLLTMIVALVMLVIGNNIVTAFGLLGALAIIRFRNVLKDTRDLVFIFLSLVVGMGIGSQRFEAAVIGALAVLATTLYLKATSFGSRGRYDGHLSCWVEGAAAQQTGLFELLRRYCRRTRQVSVRDGGVSGESEFVFQVRLRDRGRRQELVDQLRALPGTGQVALVLRDELAEL